MKSLKSNTSLLAIFACLLWASAFVGIKIGLKYTTPLNFAGIRFILAGLIVLPFVGGLKFYFSSIRNNIKIVLVIAIFQTFFQYAFFYQGISRVPASLASIIVGAQPLFIAFVAHFLIKSDPLNWKKLLIYLFGISGIVLVSFGRAKFSISEDVKIYGILFLIMVNIVAGFSNVFVAKDGTKIPALVLSSSSLILGGFMLFIVSIPLEGVASFNKSLPYYVSLVYLSLLSAAAISIWFVLLKRPGVKVSDLNFWKFLIPLAGAIMAWLILPDEKINIYAILGMLIIMTALVLLNIHKRFHQEKVPPVS